MENKTQKPLTPEQRKSLEKIAASGADDWNEVEQYRLITGELPSDDAYGDFKKLVKAVTELRAEIERLQAESRTAREEACEIVERVSLECAKEFTGTPKNFTYSALDIVEMFGKVASRTTLAIRELKHKETK